MRKLPCNPMLKITIANVVQIKFEIPSYLLIHLFHCEFHWRGGIESSYPKLTLFNVPNGNLATHGHNGLLTFFITLFNVPNGYLSTQGHNSLLTFFITLFNVPNGNLPTHGHNSLLTLFITLFNVPNGYLSTLLMFSHGLIWEPFHLVEVTLYNMTNARLRTHS